jgi:hypothetical protein
VTITRANLIDLSNAELWKLLPADRLSDVPGAETEWAIRCACVNGGHQRNDVEPWKLREQLIELGVFG